MNPDDRRARLDALFDQALELTEAARPAFVAAVDPDLNLELRELLALAAEEGDEPVDHAAIRAVIDSAMAATGAAPSAVGARFGPWRVVAELGRGGMGAVYLVERAGGEFEQRAALKLLRQGMDTLAARQRFEHERQILASLDHPNIARLLDGGSGEDGQPFLVMELVEGRPLLGYCDALRLSVERRLGLFAEAARALQYAHRHLVVHRDVKPSNIAVTDDGVLKLLDFGIAKLLQPDDEAVALTRETGLPLTPEYASPEQLRGAGITTATDVYQLGLLLFELLCGGRAQAVTGLNGGALERAVCERPLDRPSARVAREASPEIAAARATTPAGLARRLQGDLDAIVACATRKEPEGRYASVGEMLEDVNRHLRGLPVRARPDRWRYRAAKFVGRHRAAVAWAGLVVVVAAGGLTAWITQRVRAAEEARRAVEEARRAADLEGVFAQLFTFSNFAAARDTPPTRLVLDQAAKLVRERLRDQPASQSRLLLLLGRAYTATGFYTDAVTAFDGALATRPAGEGEEGLADLLSEMARSELFTGRYAVAETHLRRALALRPGDPRTLRELGDLAHTQGHLVEAERLLRQALAAAGAGDLRARALCDLGNVLRDRGARVEAERCYRESIAGFRAAGDDDDRLAGTAAEPYYARLLILDRRFAEADAILEPYLARLDRLYPDGHPLQATALREAGFSRLEQGRLAEAAESLARAGEVVTRWLGSDHPLMPRNLALQAELLRRQGRNAEAAALAREVLARFERLGIAGHPSAIDARLTLASVLLAANRRGEAAAVLRPALDVARAEFVAGDPRTRRLEDQLALSSYGGPGATR
jgi:serine/threonine-protein kinase